MAASVCTHNERQLILISWPFCLRLSVHHTISIAAYKMAIVPLNRGKSAEQNDGRTKKLSAYAKGLHHPLMCCMWREYSAWVERFLGCHQLKWKRRSSKNFWKKKKNRARTSTSTSLTPLSDLDDLMRCWHCKPSNSYFCLFFIQCKLVTFGNPHRTSGLDESKRITAKGKYLIWRIPIPSNLYDYNIARPLLPGVLSAFRIPGLIKKNQMG